MSECDRASTSKEITPGSDETFIPIPKDLEPATWPERCVYRVPQSLRGVNPSAYTPNLVSIGPLHHGDKRFQAMETQKLRYLQDFCERTGKTSSELAEPIKVMEATIRHCYEETSMFPSKDFTRMILLDSVFIIELFLRNYGEGDYITSKPLMFGHLQRDLMLLENQLPWFILEDLYNFSFPNEKKPSSFNKLTAKFMGSEWTFSSPNQKQNKLFGDCGFSFLYGHWIKDIRCKFRMTGKNQSGAETNKKSPVEIPAVSLEFHDGEAAKQEESVLHFVDWLRKEMTSRLGSGERSKQAITKLYNATKLHAAGVKFKHSLQKSPQGITFKTGVLSMPFVLLIEDRSEVFFRNTMAFEQCHLPYYSCVCDFFTFLDYLIDSVNDVDLLVQSGVIVNFMGESGAVSRMVNNLCKEICFTGSLYYDLSQGLNAHADNWCNRTVATLKNVYFANLWRGTGTVAAFVLLVLTFIQTFYAWKH